MPKIIGSVDTLGRPLVRIGVVARDDAALGTVDTGFNGELMMTAGDAAALGVTVLEGSRDVELGHGQSVGVHVGRLRVRWLDAERDAAVLISDRASPTVSGPVLLIGTKLLKPHLLLIDFASDTVEIETQE